MSGKSVVKFVALMLVACALQGQKQFVEAADGQSSSVNNLFSLIGNKKEEFMTTKQVQAKSINNEQELKFINHIFKESEASETARKLKLKLESESKAYETSGNIWDNTPTNKFGGWDRNPPQDNNWNRKYFDKKLFNLFNENYDKIIEAYDHAFKEFQQRNDDYEYDDDSALTEVEAYHADDDSALTEVIDDDDNKFYEYNDNFYYSDSDSDNDDPNKKRKTQGRNQGQKKGRKQKGTKGRRNQKKLSYQKNKSKNKMTKSKGKAMQK